MNDDTGRVPALLLCGGNAQERDAAIARLVEPAPGGQPVAVLRASGMFAGPAAPLGPHVVVKRAPIGCLCCTAGVMFRVALLELLRASRPARLLVDLGAGNHVATLEAELRSQSLARAVRLIGRLDLDATAQQAPSWPIGSPETPH